MDEQSRCANCHWLRWKIKFHDRVYVCRKAGVLSNPESSVCDGWHERGTDWHHEMTLADYQGLEGPGITLTVGLEPLHLRELIEVPDWDAQTLQEFPGVRATNEKLQANLQQRLKNAEDPKRVRIC